MRMIRDRSSWMGLFGVVVGLGLMHNTAMQVTVNAQTGSDGALARTPVSNDDRVGTAHGYERDTERLIPLQAYLTDTEGRPIQGQRCLKFQIYAGPTGDSQPFVWDETHEDVPVDKGMVNVLLGSRVQFPETATFDAAHYVGVSVGEGCDELVALEPRQQIISAVHAVDANRLGGSPLGFRANSVEITPIGAIIPWLGNPANLAGNWRICDGSAVSDPESPLDGAILPDMREKFLRGELNAGRDLLASGLNTGGSDSTDTRHNHLIPDGGAHSHSATASSAGGHSHTIHAGGDHQHQTSVIGDGSTLIAGHPSPGFGLGDNAGSSVSCAHYASWQWCGNYRYHLTSTAGTHSHASASAGSHTHAISISTAGNHTHGDTGMGGDSAEDNRPAFIALHYIIRIK